MVKLIATRCRRMVDEGLSSIVGSAPNNSEAHVAPLGADCSAHATRVRLQPGDEPRNVINGADHAGDDERCSDGGHGLSVLLNWLRKRVSDALDLGTIELER